MPLAAIALIVTACACFTSIDVTVKYLSQRYPVPLLVWARWGVQALLMFGLLAPTMRWKAHAPFEHAWFLPGRRERCRARPKRNAGFPW